MAIFLFACFLIKMALSKKESLAQNHGDPCSSPTSDTYILWEQRKVMQYL